MVWILRKDGFEFGLDSNWSFQLEVRLFEVLEDFGRSCLPVGGRGRYKLEDLVWRILMDGGGGSGIYLKVFWSIELTC